MILKSSTSKYYILTFIITLIMPLFTYFLINCTCSTAHTKSKVDWSQHFSLEYGLARHPEQQLWSPPSTADLGAGPGDVRYAVWYQKWGMSTVYLTSHYGDTLRRRLMDTPGNYLPYGPINARSVSTTQTYFN